MVPGLKYFQSFDSWNRLCTERLNSEYPRTALIEPLFTRHYEYTHMMYMSPTIHERDNEFGVLTVVSSLNPECGFEFEILNIVFLNLESQV